MKKRMIALLLSLVMLFSLLSPVSALAGETEPAASAEEPVDQPAPSDPVEDDTTPADPETPDEGEEQPTQPEEPAPADPAEDDTTPAAPEEGESENPYADMTAEEIVALLLACESTEEMDDILNALAKEQLDAITEDQWAEIQAHYEELRPEEPEEPAQEPVYYPEVSAGPIIDYPDVTPVRRAARAAAKSAVQSASGKSGNSSGLELSKTATKNKDGSYTIRMEAYATGETVTTVVSKPVDIILMLDLSNYMYDTEVSYSGPKSIKLKTLSNSTTQYYYFNPSTREYYPQTVTKSSNGYSYYGNDGNIKTGNGNTTIDVYTQTTSSTVAQNGKLAALKTAVNNFIDTVAEKSPLSRIAIVTYGNAATVMSSELNAHGTATEPSVKEDALVTVDAAGKQALKGIVNRLNVLGGLSMSDYAMADSVKIFQDVSKTAEDADGNLYYSRNRVALLFSAGVPGDGWDTATAQTEHTKGENVAQLAMHCATILKCAKTNNALNNNGNQNKINWGANVSAGQSWTKTQFENLLGVTDYTGCGATVYCVGLDLPNSGDPRNIAINSGSAKAGALANEFFYRISSHRPTGAHYVVGPDKDSSAYELFDDTNDPTITVKVSATETLQTSWRALYNTVASRNNYGGSGAMYFFYPDMLTRNLTDGYFLTADSTSQDNLNRLSDIFKDIAEKTDGGASTTLDASAVVKDIVTPYFTMPTNAEEITVTTAESDGSTSSWKAEEDFTGVVTVDAVTRAISVTGFSFKDYWCGNQTDKDNVTTFHNGKKLIIEFTVKVQDGFLGGNAVPTNGNMSGIYKPNDNTPVDVFTVPTVDIAIPDVTVDATDKNVYYGNGLTADDMMDKAVIKCGKVDITNPSTVEDWQKAFVEITINKPEDIESCIEDSQYTISASVTPSPKKTEGSEGSVEAKSGTGTANINVFTPNFTVAARDIWADYGVAVDLNTHAVESNDPVVWKHGETVSTAAGVKMLGGTAPDISDKAYTFTLVGTADGTLSADKPTYTTGEKDANFDITGMTCKVGGKDYSVTADGEGGLTVTKAVSGETHDFTIHINHFRLTITKSGCAAPYEQDFIFHVEKKDTTDDYEVVIRGNGSKTMVDLVCGRTYTVSEEESWSWRYALEKIAGNDVTCTNTISYTKPAEQTKAVTVTNKLSIAKWLDGISSKSNKNR